MVRTWCLVGVLIGAAPLWAEAQTPDTYFIDLNRSFSTFGDYVYQGFTTYANTTFDVRFAATYRADAAIIPESELRNFMEGRSFSGWSVFDDTYGTNVSVTIGPGSYYAVVRNQESASNTIRFEVDYSINLTDSRFYDWYVKGANYIQPYGGKLWQPITIESGVRYFIDGCNSGVETYLIPGSELSNFQNDREFRYYTDYSGTSNAYPGLWELRLNPGSYYLVFRNNGTLQQAVTYQAERWIPYRASAESASVHASSGEETPPPTAPKRGAVVAGRQTLSSTRTPVIPR